MIKVEGLTRAYGSFIAVDDISFECQPGTVTGFLGPNGAGKTTTMRVMVGLTPATHGEVTIGGLHYRADPQPGPPRRRPARRVGAARGPHRSRGARDRCPHDGPAEHPRRRDARRWCRSTPRSPSAASATTRSACGSGSASRTRCSATRRVLILDEPANGLDPAGIRWMRGLLKGYADRGGTVLLSSHLLHEVEQIADEMILIGNGRIVARGTRDELLQARLGRSHDHPGHRARQPSCSARRWPRRASTVHPAGCRAPRHRRAGRRRPGGGRAADRAHRPARRERGRSRGPVPRADRRHRPRGRRPARRTGARRG